VRGRNSDNTLIKARLGWAPDTRLQAGMEKTYRWIDGEMRKQAGQRRKAYSV
jgi:nucleoside-diphosphate-sugar epimerase